MSTIVTRATKGSALTWTEGDANITNLNNDKIEDIVEDLTPQLGGNLDVNGNSIVSTSNANINIEPNGSGKVVTTKQLNASILGSTQSAGDEGGQLELAIAATNTTLSGGVAIDINQNRLRIFETGGTNRGAYIDLSTAATGVGTNLLAGSGGGLANIVEDLSPQLGGDLDVNGKNITSASNGNINITPNGSGNISLAPATGKIILGSVDWPTTGGTNGQVLTTNGTGTASWTTISSGGLANVVEDTTPQLGGDLDVQANIITTSVANGNITITPNGTGNVILSTDTVTMGDLDSPSTLTTNGAGSLTINTNSGTNSGTIQLVTGANANINITPNGTGKTRISAMVYNEGAIFDLGTTGGTIAPTVTNGNVQKITLNSALTINAFTSPVAGQSLTLIIYGGTAYTSITSTMKFAGGVKTLTATAGCIDILSVYYDGTTYFASLGKGFA